MLVLVIKLRQANRHFSAAGAGRRYHHKRFFGFDKIIFTVSVIADYKLYVGRVVVNGVVAVNINAERIQLFGKSFCKRLRVVLCQNHTSDDKPE